MTPRSNLTTALQEIWREQNASRYRVAHRGPINWASFDFAKSQFGVAIMLDECKLFPNKAGFTEAVLSFELFTRLPNDPNEIDDGLLDSMYRDVEQVLIKAQSLVDEQGNSLIGKIDRASANVIEAHDAMKGVQGLVVTMRIDF